MSAIAAKVFSGLMKASTAAIRKRTPKIANSQRPRSARVASVKFWAEAPRNIRPMITPTVVIEASSNWRMTTATIVQTIPNASQSHHIFDSDLIAWRSSPLRLSAGRLDISQLLWSRGRRGRHRRRGE